jgi:hypothetical protein
MKAYAFVFAKTHDANHWRKSFSLANRERENFYLAFTGELVRHSSYDSSTLPTLPEILPSTLQIFPCPLTLFSPSFFFFFLFYLTY